MSPNCFLVHTALDGRRRRRPLHNVRPSRYNVTVAVPRTTVYSSIFALEKLLEVSVGSVRFKQASEFKCALKSFHMILVQKYMADHTTPRHFLGEQDSSHAKVNRGIKDAALAPPICGDYTNTLSPPPPCQQSSHGLPLLYCVRHEFFNIAKNKKIRQNYAI